VLLDTNALFLPFRDRFPLVEEVERLTAPALVGVPSSVVAELDRLVARAEVGAPLAREFARRFPIVESSGRGDQGLVELAARRRATVVTGDRELRRRLVAAGVVVLSPRGATRLVRWEPGPSGLSARPPGRATATPRITSKKRRQRRS